MINKISIIIIIGAGAYYLLSFLTPEVTDCKGVSDAPPQIEFIDNENELTSDFTVSRKHLAGIKKKHEQLYAQYVVRGDTLGLTLASYGYKMHFSSAFKRMTPWGQTFCPYIQNIVLEFDYASEMYVAKEYVPNKCTFDVILKHEFDHHQVNLTNKKTYMAWLKKDFPAILQELSKSYEPLTIQQLQPMSQKIKEGIEDVLDTYIQNMYHNTLKENERLDTTAEYLRLNKEIAQCYREDNR